MTTSLCQCGRYSNRTCLPVPANRPGVDNPELCFICVDRKRRGISLLRADGLCENCKTEPQSRDGWHTDLCRACIKAMGAQ